MISFFVLGLAQMHPLAADRQGAAHMAAPKPAVTGADSCLPMRFADGMPVIAATLGGRAVTLGFDTGAPGGPLLDAAIISDLKLPRIGDARMGDPSMKNMVAVGLFELPGLTIGNLEIGKWTAKERPTRPSARLADPDGIIGLTAFEGFVVTIDYPGRRILLTKGRLPEPDGRTAFRYEGPIPRVPLSVEGREIEAHLDTGNARYGLIVPESFAAQLAGHARRFPIGVARTLNNQFDLKAIPIGESKAGEFPLYAGTAAFPAPAMRANIGAPLLRDMIVTVDPANAIVGLRRATPGLENGCPTA